MYFEGLKFSDTVECFQKYQFLVFQDLMLSFSCLKSTSRIFEYTWALVSLGSRFSHTICETTAHEVCISFRN